MQFWHPTTTLISNATPSAFDIELTVMVMHGGKTYHRIQDLYLVRESSIMFSEKKMLLYRNSLSKCQYVPRCEICEESSAAATGKGHPHHSSQQVAAMGQAKERKMSSSLEGWSETMLGSTRVCLRTLTAKSTVSSGQNQGQLWPKAGHLWPTRQHHEPLTVLSGSRNIWASCVGR